MTNNYVLLNGKLSRDIEVSKNDKGNSFVKFCLICTRDGINSYSDYITIVNKDGNKKLNINRYIGRKILNKSKDSDNIKTEVLYSDRYMDYEIYKIKITNNTDNTILLDILFLLIN